MHSQSWKFATQVSLIALLAGAASNAAFAQSAPSTETAREAEVVVVTGSRIPRPDLSATSPVAITTGEQLRLERAVTVEDFSAKLPQLSGGVKSTATGSDARGAQTLDLRSLGQNRTLVLINGTRATPFSFRNAVDVSAIPASLLKRVDVLTGGAAAVYGADAVSGVVNFIINDEFEGININANIDVPKGGGQTYSIDGAYGIDMGGRGNLVGYLAYAQREGLRTGDRSWAFQNVLAPSAGGIFTDVASGRIVSTDANGNVSNGELFQNFQPQFLLTQPLERFNAAFFGKYNLTDKIEVYGRAMFADTTAEGAGFAGEAPVAVDRTVSILATNTFIPAAVRSQLTFVNGAANVRVRKSLTDLGLRTSTTERQLGEFQLGLRGDLTDAIKWDIYAQTGKVDEKTLVNGDGVATANGVNRFDALVNSSDIFKSGNSAIAGLGSTLTRDIREREVNVYAASISGTTADLFSLPAGPIGFSLGVEQREDSGVITADPVILAGTSFTQGSQTAYTGGYDVSEVYGELLVPLLANLPLIKKLELEGAYRRSDYSNAGEFDTDKIGFSWEIVSGVRVRGTQQTVARAPNLGEFAAPTFSIPFANLRTVPRLNPRYPGDPCALGTGNAAQCTRLGYKGTYDSLNPTNLTGQYFFGGNKTIEPETGETRTIGLVFAPAFTRGFSATIDYYDIELNNAVGQIQPVDALNSCYILDPRADNPLCLAVSRDPVTGFIKDGFVNDRNLGTLKQSGYDVGARYSFDIERGTWPRKMVLSYQGTFVTDYTVQRTPVLTPIDCKGTYGGTCSSDLVSNVQADYKHRASTTLSGDRFTAQVGWQYIGGLRNSAPGATDTVRPYSYLDLNLSWKHSGALTVNFGVDNLTDAKPPLVRSPILYNTLPDTYDVLGRTIGLSVTWRK
jgi:iron complex outermembrane recepter protein